MYKLSDTVERKFIEQYEVSDWEIETEDGYKPILSTNKTVEYVVYRVELENGLSIECADTHILIESNHQEVFAQDSLGVEILTKLGTSKVVSVTNLGYSECMYDLSVDSEEHTYYTNDILSHNTTTSAAYILWYTLFQDDKTVAILANKATAAREVLSRYQIMYEELPTWMQQGISGWNKGDVVLENKSRIFTSPTTASGIRGRSVNMLYVDETAIIPNTLAEQFFASIYPTISAGDTTKILLSSTPLGYNHFWKMWNDAENGRNGFVNLFIPYWKIPGRDDAWAEEQKRLLGEVKFNQEIMCNFLGSSLTLISANAIAKMSLASPVYTNDSGIDLYELPEKDKTYAIVADTAKGVGGDYSCLVIMDITEAPYKMVGKFRNNTISPLLYPNIIYQLGKQYNNAHVLIELNSSEQVPYILQSELEYENILYVNRSNVGTGSQAVTGGFGKAGTKLQLGVITDKQVKRLGCQNFKTLVEEGKIIIQDADAISEISTFIETRGSYAADEGYHDDIVMCLVLFSWLTINPYFKELNNVNLREIMFKKKMQMIDDELTPFGSYNDGNPEIEVLHDF